MELLTPIGLESAYHRHFGEQFGKESRPTHFHRGNQEAGFHIDYCFVPSKWIAKISGVQVGEFEQWRQLSDHVPVIVDIEI